MRALRAPALVLLACALAPSAARAAERPPRCQADVPSAIVIEVSTGTVACATNPDQRRSIASTTKLMTALLTLERAKLSDVYTAADYQPSPAESQIGLYKSELIHHEGPWRDVDQVEAATASWVLWFNTERTHGSIDDLTPLEVEQLDYARNEPVTRAG